MKYFILLADYGELPTWDQLSTEEQEKAMAQHYAFTEACNQRDGLTYIGGEALAEGPMATTLRTRGGEMTVTDGPFAEAAEHIGGFFVLDAPDLETVVDLCRILPGYDIEIRPVLEVE